MMTKEEYVACEDEMKYRVIRALRRVLEPKTDPRLINIIVEDLLEELRNER